MGWPTARSTWWALTTRRTRRLPNRATSHAKPGMLGLEQSLASAGLETMVHTGGRAGPMWSG